MNNLEVIGIDHGWSQMKTVHEVFSSGVEEILSEPAFFDDVLEYDGKYYKIGTKSYTVSTAPISMNGLSKIRAYRIKVILNFAYN